MTEARVQTTAVETTADQNLFFRTTTIERDWHVTLKRIKASWELASGTSLAPDANALVESLLHTATAVEDAHRFRNPGGREKEVEHNLVRLLETSKHMSGSAQYITRDNIISALTALCPLYPFC